MRIEKVVVENINSLCGRFEIDLTDRAFAGGLFAIVGPSGAGKTTVLDAVCLALYGKTPRIDSVSPEHDELMSKGAQFCRTEVIFTAGGRRCKSVFAHERSKGTKPFRPAKREILIQDADGVWQVAAAATREAEEKIKEITGLDFQQFTRSVMLAQFHFAEFLQADSTERAKILEKITDMDIYRRISIAVYERTQRQKQLLADTLSRIESTPILSGSEEAARTREARRLESAVAEHQSVCDLLGRCAAASRRLESLRGELDRLKAAEQTLADENRRCEQALKAAEQAERDCCVEQDMLAKTLVEVRRLDIEKTHTREDIARIESEISRENDRIGQTKKEILRLFMKYEPNAAGERYKALYDTDDVSDELRSKAKAALDEAKAKAAAVDAQMAKLLSEKDEAYWQARLNALRKAQPVVEAAETLGEAQKRLEEFQKQRSDLEKERAGIEQAFKKAEEELEYARLNKRFGEQRRALEEGKPCPLCGAIHHPYAGKAYDEKYYDAAKQKYDDVQSKRDDLKSRLRETELRIADERKLADEKARYIEENKAALDALDGRTDTQAVIDGIDEIEQRIRDIAELQSRRAKAAEHVADMTVRFADVDKDVARIDDLKRLIAEAEAVKKEKELSKAKALMELKTLFARREALFGDKDADAEETAAKNRLKDAQESKDKARRAAEQAGRAAEQNLKDIERVQKDEETESQKFAKDYARAAEAASRLENVSDDDDVTALFGRYTDEAARLDEKSEAMERVQTALAALISGETVQLGSVRQILKTNAERRRDVKTLKEEEKALRAALAKWERLNSLIGSASGDKFSRMAQSITFDSLLRFANVSLKRMTDRYILVREEAGPMKPLELAVIDTYQAGEKRPVINLSGGESFIVSMALALGLSEMSSGTARIDSLFIDEGFASLDEDYLEAALQTLSALGSREGKLIGVISHVEALKNRIDVQIEVTRRSGGRSALSGPGVKAIVN